MIFPFQALKGVIERRIVCRILPRFRSRLANYCNAEFAEVVCCHTSSIIKCAGSEKKMSNRIKFLSRSYLTGSAKLP